MVKRSKAKKRIDLIRHFIKRSCERAQILGLEDVETINHKIQHGQADFLWRESATRTHWRVTHKGDVLWVVYNKPFSTVCTVLPSDRPGSPPGRLDS